MASTLLLPASTSFKDADFIFDYGDVNIKIKLSDGKAVTGHVFSNAMAMSSPDRLFRR